VYRATTASASEHQEVLGFHEKRGLAQTAWLAWNVEDALAVGGDWVWIVVCRLGDEIAGVAGITWSPEKGIEAGYQARADAVDHEAAAALVREFPLGAPGSVSLFDPMMQDYFSRLPGAVRSDCDIYYTVDAEKFRPVGEEQVAELTAADAGLFEGCERQPHWEDAPMEQRLFAIVRDGKAASSVCTSPIGPRMPSGRRAASVGALHTETPHRRKGLARRIVSHVTELILREGNLPIYWTEPENVPSQNLAWGLGYWQYAQEARFKWVRA